MADPWTATGDFLSNALSAVGRGLGGAVQGVGEAWQRSGRAAPTLVGNLIAGPFQAAQRQKQFQALQGVDPRLAKYAPLVQAGFSIGDILALDKAGQVKQQQVKPIYTWNQAKGVEEAHDPATGKLLYSLGAGDVTSSFRQKPSTARPFVPSPITARAMQILHTNNPADLTNHPEAIVQAEQEQREENRRVALMGRTPPAEPSPIVEPIVGPTGATAGFEAFPRSRAGSIGSPAYFPVSGPSGTSGKGGKTPQALINDSMNRARQRWTTDTKYRTATAGVMDKLFGMRLTNPDTAAKFSAAKEIDASGILPPDISAIDPNAKFTGRLDRKGNPIYQTSKGLQASEAFGG